MGTYKTNGGNNIIGNPIIWRIVRINEDGSIRLISQNNVKYSVGASDEDADYSPNLFMDPVIEWYNENISVDNNIDSKIVTGNYCSDCYDGSTSNLTFKCSDSNTINSKVGIISAYEMVYGGALYNETVTNNRTYLGNRGSDVFWTLSPGLSNQNRPAFFWNTTNFSWTDYSLARDYVDIWSVAAAVRAVVNLSPNVIIGGGDGSSAKPYIIQ